MNELALFAGAGGGILGGVLLGWRTVCAVEQDRHCIGVLSQRQNDGLLPPFPIWDDVRTFSGGPWRGAVDVVSAGFPCQPFSLAGKRGAEADERNLWPETIRILREVRPRFALLENVPGLLNAIGADGRPYFGRVLGDLAALGYDAEWTVLGADDLGAPHRRKRLWILAHAAWDVEGRPQQRPKRKRTGARGQSVSDDSSGRRTTRRTRRSDPIAAGQSEQTLPAVADADGSRWGERRGAVAVQPEQSAAECGRQNVADAAGVAEREPADQADAQSAGGEARPESGGGSGGWWTRDPADADGDAADGAAIAWRERRFGLAQPGLGRVADGIPNRVDRLKALGNAQVPGVAAAAWRLLTMKAGIIV